MKAVRFDQYGGPEVLQVVDVPTPVPGEGEVLVRVVTAGTNPGEAAIRSGALHARFPARFPEGQGSDLAGEVVAVGAGVEGPAIGADVVGLSDLRNAQAEYALLPAGRVVPKPDGLGWDAAATLYVAGTTAVALLRVAGVQRGDTVVVSGAAGGVGLFATQLAIRDGARVIAVASPPNHALLADWGAQPVAYGDGLEERVRSVAPRGVDALLDAHGGGYLDLGLALGVSAPRLVTLTDRDRAGQIGAATTGMSSIEDPPAEVRRLADAVAEGAVQVPVKARFPLERVQEAYRVLEQRSGVGKVVLDVSAA